MNTKGREGWSDQSVCVPWVWLAVEETFLGFPSGFLDSRVTGNCLTPPLFVDGWFRWSREYNWISVLPPSCVVWVSEGGDGGAEEEEEEEEGAENTGRVGPEDEEEGAEDTGRVGPEETSTEGWEGAEMYEGGKDMYRGGTEDIYGYVAEVE
jgi:hypothetical protein